MKVLLDHNLPRQLRTRLAGHLVFSARQLDADRLTNGLLIEFAERQGFDVLVTADQSIFYQQDNRHRKISLVVVSTNKRAALLGASERVLSAVNRSKPGSYLLLEF